MPNSGQKLWKKAKKIIPGGNQLLSKRSEMFLPEHWPSYYKKAKGCRIWDLDNKVYFDFAGMGVTSCVLGYADPDVNKAVKKAIGNGSMGTLNSFEEVQLAEKLISLHPWAKMVRFAKTGGEACSIAIRIARATSGKDKIAFCGYHGWHDWYLSSNLKNSKNLDEQLLPGLNPKGVPKNLNETSLPFKFNDIDSFKKVIEKNKNEIGTIIMEPQRRGEIPKEGFLKHIKDTAKKIGAVLIFDEITIGFHDNLGGKHLSLGINPDVAIFSKAMGNGFPIAAIVGKKEVMDVAQDTFVSSTMWTERIGFIAALATIKKMEEKSVQKKLIQYGKIIKNGWQEISNKTNIKIKISGLDSMPSFSFVHKKALTINTFFIQEMLKNGYLAQTGLATSFAYTNKIIDGYLTSVNRTFQKMTDFVNNDNIKLPLKGPIKHASFRRLT